MFIKRSTYDAALELINEQLHTIEQQQDLIANLNTHIMILKHNNNLLNNMLKADPYDIDYPNERGLKGANTTTPDTNGNIRF